MPVLKTESVAAVSAGPGVLRRVLAYGPNIMCVEFTYEKGGIGAVHAHPHEQFGYISRGRFELEEGGVKTVVGEGDTYYIPPNIPHGAVALEAGIIVDGFTPIREDFIGKSV